MKFQKRSQNYVFSMAYINAVEPLQLCLVSLKCARSYSHVNVT